MLKLSALAELVHGQLHGEDGEVSGLRGLDEAQENDITFLANPAYKAKLFTTKAHSVLVSAFIPDLPFAQIVVADPYLAMATISQEFSRQATPAWGCHPSAIFSPDATISPACYIGPGCVIEPGAIISDGAILKAQVYIGTGAVIGANSLLYPGVKVLDNCKIGADNILYAGAIIGSDGFGYAPDKAGHRHKIPQLGIVELGDNVEVGANTTIDRATFGATKIGSGTKIDNLVQVAHNVQIGQDSVLCSQVGIAGSTIIGDRVIAAGQVGINGHITIGNDCIIAAQSGVAQALKDGSKVAGSPALPHLHWLKVSVIFNKLDELIGRLAKVERQLAQPNDTIDKMER